MSEVTTAEPVADTRDRELARLRAEVRGLRELVHSLTDRLVEAQDASEGWYRVEYERTGGPRLHKLQPFGSLTGRFVERDVFRLVRGTAGGESA